ncbi:MAG: GTPase Era [Bacteroidetes bacterium]|jgi:GTP-binding protein Era|nr:MAG: GTPase Era [Cryomorphaceae bacterium BACL23 MAG-120924-bin60]MBL6627782.1 GTPase Era [Cryomorphaceae bacterium]MDA0363738.1 GTPase Era [Bacteroidota bacterium]MDP5067642.1 GTPase Era [Schleiferiaceae bacterium]NCZ95031.1 GTPase Era [Flavobacteriia bacterium]
MEKVHKAGFVNLIGHPNVGKSTLTNALVGERLNIITPKAQTTRHRIFGILNGETPAFDYQLVFSDTPGVLDPAYALQETMLTAVKSAFEDADIFLYVVELGEGPLKHEGFFKGLQEAEQPVLVLLNKVDLHDQERLERETALWTTWMPRAEIIPISALTKFNLDYVLNRVLQLIPESPPYFEKGQLTDRSERFVTSEIIREQVLMNYSKEIPYSVEVGIDTFVEEEKIIKIRAVLYVARDSQKGILIGHKGAALKRVGIGARKRMQDFFQKHVHLELYVKVQADWRNDRSKLKRFGYE